MILSRTGEYGVQIALHLALRGNPGYVPVRTLAESSDIPFHFLGKICHRLTRAGILASYKGPNGGVSLARPASEITLFDVVRALDGAEVFERCVLGLSRCNDAAPCPLHHTWVGVRQRILQTISQATLSELATELAEGKAILRLIPDAKADAARGKEG